MDDDEAQERREVIVSNWTLVQVAEQVIGKLLAGEEYGITQDEKSAMQATFAKCFQRMYEMLSKDD